MAEQFQQVNALGELPNVCVRVQPFSTGLHWGLVSGSFIILRFEDDDAPMVYADGFTGNLWFREPREINSFTRAFENITASALSEEQSRELIHQALEELRRHVSRE